MKTFDLTEVRKFTERLDARREQCDHAEGTECANLDGTLLNYAKLCHHYTESVRQWGRAIFYGNASFDPQVEDHFFSFGLDLYDRASDLWSHGQEMQGDCFVLEGGAPLGAALWQLQLLLKTWITPQLAVAPLARIGLPPDARDEVQSRLDALPKLPFDWRPVDERQARLYRKLSGRRR